MQPSRDNKKERQFFDVHIRPKRKHFDSFFRWVKRSHVVNLRPSLIKRKPYAVVGAVGLFVLGILVGNRLLTRAEITDFYPATCLGTWHNVQNAAGQPENFNSASAMTGFSKENSAAYAGEIGSQIFCGGFLSPDAEQKGDLQSVALTLVWHVGEEAASSTPVSVEVGNTPGEKSVTSSDENALPSNTEPQSLNTPSSMFSFVLGRANAQESPGEVSAGAEPPPVPIPPAPRPEVPASPETSAPEEPTAIILPPLEAVLVPASSSTGPVEPAETSTPEAAPIPVPTDENFLNVTYSTDGVHWSLLAKVNPSNWANFTASIPVTTWTEMKQLQIMVEGIPTSLQPVPKVYLAGMFVEARYIVSPLGSDEQTAVSPNPEDLPVVVVGDEKKPVPVDKAEGAFAGNETPTFDLDLANLSKISTSTPNASTTVNTTASTTETSAESVNPPPAPPPEPVPPQVAPPPSEEILPPVSGTSSEQIIPPPAASSSAQEPGPSPPEPPAPAPQAPAPPPPPPTLPSGSEPNSASPSSLQTNIKKAISWLNFSLHTLQLSRPQSAKAQERSSSTLIALLSPQNPVVARIYNPVGVELDVEPKFLTVNDTLRVNVPDFRSKFRPGTYTLKMWILRNNVVYYTENQFVWGVLATNFNKSIYAVGDTATVNFGVLTDEGATVCDASIRMTITTPLGKRIIRDTANGSIQFSKTCGRNNVTSDPDYSAEVPVLEAGSYEVNISVKNGSSGVREFTDKFEAQDTPAFDVERSGPTRIYPPAKYQMSIKIKANTDFAGDVTETIPAGFLVSSSYGGRVMPQGEAQAITWTLNLKKGDIAVLSYQFDAPDISPYLYKLGPLEIGDWREIREWQIASDAITATGTFFWGTQGTGTDGVKFRSFTEPNTLGAAVASPALGKPTTTLWIVAKTAPTRQEELIATLRSASSTTGSNTSTLVVYRCLNGCTQASDMTTMFNIAGIGTSAGAGGQDCDTAAIADTCNRPFDLAYESLSGTALVVYAKSSDATTLYYRTWNGSTSSSEQTFLTFGSAAKPPVATGKINWIALKPRGENWASVRTNDILYGFNTVNEDIGVGIWNGSTSSIARFEVTTNSANNSLQPGNFDVAWETLSGDAMVAFSPAANQWEYRTMTSSTQTWSVSSTITTNAEANGGWIRLASDPSTDRIMAALADIATNSNSDVIRLAVWRGTTSTGAWTLGTTDAAAETQSGRLVDTAWGKSATSSENLSVYGDAGTAPVFTPITWDPTNGFVANGAAVAFSMSDDAWSLKLTGSPNTNKVMVTGVSGGGASGCDVGAQEYDLDLSDWQTALATTITGSSSLTSDGTTCNITWTLPATQGGPQQHDFAYRAYSPWAMNWIWFTATSSASTPTSGAPLAATNTTPTNIALSAAQVRLRYNFEETGNLAETDARKKLQYTTGDPNSPSSTWTDVDEIGGSGIWRYLDMDCVSTDCADNTALPSTLLPSSTQAGTWVMSGATTTNPTNMDQNALAVQEYEFILESNGAVATTTYYFRAWDNASVMPMLRKQAANLTTPCVGNSACTYPSLKTQDATPLSISNVLVNAGNAITLTPNTTTSISVTFTVNDGHGCNSLFTSGNVTTTLFRSGVSTTCGVADPALSKINTLNCYVIATTTNSCSGQGSVANATATLNVYYFAEATDASSSFASQGWGAYITANDTFTTVTTSSALVELNTLLAFSVTTSSINYGNVDASSTTSSTNQIATVRNAGNSSSTLSLSGTAMTLGSNSISTSSQHYATSTFTFGGLEQALQDVATAVTGFLLQNPISGKWQLTADMPATATSDNKLGVAAYNGYLYATGGSGTSTVNFSQISATGSLNVWAKTTSLPSSTCSHGSFADQGYLFVIGGEPACDGTATSTVRLALLNSTGSVSSWATTTPLPANRTAFGMGIYNHYAYVVGGTSGGSQTSSALFGLISSTGTIASWATTTPLPAPRGVLGFTVGDGYAYAVGGTSDGSVGTTTTFFAPVASTGSLGTWRAGPNLVTSTDPTQKPSLIYDNGLLYLFGYTVNATTTVLFLPTVSNGIAPSTPWSETPTTQALANAPGLGQGAIAYQGYAYIIGGFNQGSEEQFTPLVSKNTYWGLRVPNGTPVGVFQGVNTFTAVFNP